MLKTKHEMEAMDISYVVKPMKDGHLMAVSSLMGTSRLMAEDSEDSDEVLESLYADDETTGLVVESTINNAPRVVGYVFFSWFPDGIVMQDLVIHRKRQRFGIGTALLHRVKGITIQRRSERLTVNVGEYNVAAQLFLKENDFKCIGTEEYYDNTFLRMEWEA